MILVARRVRIRLGSRRRINEALQYPKPRVAQESEEEESSSLFLKAEAKKRDVDVVRLAKNGKSWNKHGQLENSLS